MALNQSTLATELQGLVPTDNEGDAITALTDAFATYAAGATANGVPILSAAVNTGKAAMASALVGMSVDGAGVTKIPNSVAAFWAAAIVPGAFGADVGPSTPQPCSGLAALLASTFGSNQTGDKSLSDATAAIAADMHSQSIVGGVATFNISGTPTAFPIV